MGLHRRLLAACAVLLITADALRRAVFTKVDSSTTTTTINWLLGSKVAAVSGVVVPPFRHQAGFVELPEGSGSGGRISFPIECSEDTQVTFEAEAICPDGGSDSFFLLLGGSEKRWHLRGPKNAPWTWMTGSPTMLAKKGRREVILRGREAGVKLRSLRLAIGADSCRLLGHVAEKVGDVVEERFQTQLKKQVTKPFPGLGSCWGDTHFAFAALHQDSQVDTALSMLENINANIEKPRDCYWAFSIVTRLLLHGRTKYKLSQAAVHALHELMWHYTKKDSEFKVAANTSAMATGHIIGSENHDLMHKGTHLLALQSLDEVGRGSDTLDDGKTVLEHLVAWEGYFVKYFQDRARLGLLVEVASPTYGKYSTQVFYNIRDLSRSQPLRELADKFLSLYWADYAHDFLKGPGIRVGASARHYKVFQSSYDTDSLRGISSAYGWHSSGKILPGHPAFLAAVTSSYRPPKVVSDIALRNVKPHLYTSRRPGAGRGRDGVGYWLTWAPNILRVSWWTPHYVQGTMAYDRDAEYTAISYQNRQMGVYFADGVGKDYSDRVVVFGIGKVQDFNRTGYREITGVTGPGCSIISRDVTVTARHSAGTRIFVSTPLWEGKVERGDWFFVQSGSGYAGVRAATGGWTVRESYNKKGHSDGLGKYLDLENMWAPIIIQTGLSSDFANFAAFVDMVSSASRFHFTDNRELIYTSLASNVYRVWESQKHPPTIDKVPLDLYPTTPVSTYESPFIHSSGGVVQLTAPSGKTLTLNMVS